MAQDKDSKEGEKKEKKPIDIVLIGLIAFAVFDVGALGYGCYLVYASTLGWRAPQITEEQLVEEKEKGKKENEISMGPLVYSMEKFTVNLAGDPLRDPKRTIQMEVNLEMLNKDGFEEVMNADYRAKARDKIIQIIGNKAFSELETTQGKLFLKDQIAAELNAILDKGIVKDVYFTSFVVQ